MGDPLASTADDVVRSLHRIWEDKAVGVVYSAYDQNVLVHQTGADEYGRAQVAQTAVQRLAAFPDLRWFGEQVICASSLDGVFLSHRVTSTGHHLGHGVYGPPTGRRVQRREITQCLVREGRIQEVWSVQDELATVRQLGLDEWALARVLAQAEADLGGSPALTGFAGLSVHTLWEAPLNDLEGPPVEGAGIPEVLCHQIWNGRMLNRMGQVYAPDAVISVPGHRRLRGPQALTHYVLEWLAAFPDGVMQLEHVASPGPAAHGGRVAARWTFQGTHTGPGVYGPPTGRRVQVLGVSHFDVHDGRVVREDMVWNEFALLKQLCWPGRA